MIKKTIAILLMIVVTIPSLKTNATVLVPEQNSTTTIKVEDKLLNPTSYQYLTVTDFRLKNFIEIVEEAKKLKEEIKAAQEKQAAIDKARQAVIDDNSRKNNVHVYQENLTSVSGITVEELNQVFYKIGKPKMAKYSQAFIDAEKQYGVNALFIASIVAQESGWATKAGGTNGTNLTGHAVYNAQATGTTFNSGYEGILETARLLKEDYLTSSGKYFNGYSVEDVNLHYCLLQDMKTTDYKWSVAITNIENTFEKVYQHDVKTLEQI
jgi:beta-N-acetylglucosaminidase